MANMDTIEAKKNLVAICAEIEKLQNLSRGLMTAKEMVEVDAKIKRHKEQVKNIRKNLFGTENEISIKHKTA